MSYMMKYYRTWLQEFDSLGNVQVALHFQLRWVCTVAGRWPPQRGLMAESVARPLSLPQSNPRSINQARKQAWQWVMTAFAVSIVFLKPVHACVKRVLACLRFLYAGQEAYSNPLWLFESVFQSAWVGHSASPWAWLEPWPSVRAAECGIVTTCKQMFSYPPTIFSKLSSDESI